MFKKILQHKLLSAAFLLGLIFCCSSFSSSATSLVAGLLISIFIGNAFSAETTQISKKLLSLSIIGLGAGMNLVAVTEAGLNGLTYTVTSIAFTLLVGLALSKLFKTDTETSLLISVGTAICGGSAIASVAPAIKAKTQSITIALGTVFTLNAVALVLFPSVGHFLSLTQQQFGLWSALAIHDTSSVVGAGLQYGPEALKIGTTIKLARALWIVPLTFLISFIYRKNKSADLIKIQPPWFILGFLIVAALFTWVNAIQFLAKPIELIAKKGFLITLFLIGANISINTIKSVGYKPFVLGLTLWLITSTTTLLFILN